MCFPAVIAAMGLGGGAAAAGAGAAATTAGTLSTLGSIVSIGGSLLSGIQGSKAASAQAAAIENQRATERQLNATQDQRQRGQMMTMIAQQRADLAARGVQLDSPTAIALGQSAAQEMSFDSQAIRTTGRARDAELSAEARLAKMRGSSAMLRGVFSGLGTLVESPDLWPGIAKLGGK